MVYHTTGVKESSQNQFDVAAHLTGLLWSWWCGMLPLWWLGFDYQAVPIHPGLIASDYGVHESGSLFVAFLSFSLQWKSDESTKHYLIQMLFAINWCYWQAGKNSHIHMKGQGHLKQACFIEIHQVFREKKIGSDIFLTEYYFSIYIYIIWFLNCSNYRFRSWEFRHYITWMSRPCIKYSHAMRLIVVHKHTMNIFVISIYRLKYEFCIQCILSVTTIMTTTTFNQNWNEVGDPCLYHEYILNIPKIIFIICVYR